MNKILLSFLTLLLPISVLALTTTINPIAINPKSTVSGELGKGIQKINTGALREVVRPKSRIETAAERQKQRENELARQKEEEQAREDQQRAVVAAYNALKQAEEKARENELQKQQDTETIEAYCDRAMRQGFLKSRLRSNTVSECIDKLNALKRAGQKLIERRLKEEAERKRLGEQLRRQCIQDYIRYHRVSEYCRNILNSSSTGSTAS